MKKWLLSAAVAAVCPVLLARAASAAPISSLYPSTPGSVSLTGTVTAILNVASTTDDFVISDGTGSALSYHVLKTTYTPTIGDNISITATNTPYQGAPELVASGYTETTNSTGNTVTPSVLSVSGFDATGNGAVAFAPYAEGLVELDNVYFPAMPSTLVTNTTYTISDAGGNEAHLYLYASDSNVKAVSTAFNAANPSGTGGGYYDIVGYDDEFFGSPEIYPLSITAVPEPASMSVLSLVAVGLLSRRRHRVV